MKKIAVFNQKGGVGKTAVAINVSCCMADYLKRRVLVIDCDPQANASTYLMADNINNVSDTITDYIAGEKEEFSLPYTVSYEKTVRLKDSAGKITNRVQKRKCSLDVMPINQDINLIDIEENTILKDLLDGLDNEYDYCFMDCPPNLSGLTINALTAADYVLVPTTPTKDAFAGYGLILDVVQTLKNNGTNVNLKILGVVLNRVNKGRAVDKFFIERTLEQSGKTVCNTKIRESSLVEQANVYCKPLNIYKPRENVSKDFKELAKELDIRMRR